MDEFIKVVGTIFTGIFEVLNLLPPEFLVGVVLTIMIIVGIKKLID